MRLNRNHPYAASLLPPPLLTTGTTCRVVGAYANYWISEGPLVQVIYTQVLPQIDCPPIRPFIVRRGIFGSSWDYGSRWR